MDVVDQITDVVFEVAMGYSVGTEKAGENDLMQLFKALDYCRPIRKVKLFHLIHRFAVSVSFHQLIYGLRNPCFSGFHTYHIVPH
jgi:hypothetical protein